MGERVLLRVYRFQCEERSAIDVRMLCALSASRLRLGDRLLNPVGPHPFPSSPSRPWFGPSAYSAQWLVHKSSQPDVSTEVKKTMFFRIHGNEGSIPYNELVCAP
jgi:hypothetical protein